MHLLNRKIQKSSYNRDEIKSLTKKSTSYFLHKVFYNYSFLLCTHWNIRQNTINPSLNRFRKNKGKTAQFAQRKKGVINSNKPDKYKTNQESISTKVKHPHFTCSDTATFTHHSAYRIQNNLHLNFWLRNLYFFWGVILSPPPFFWPYSIFVCNKSLFLFCMNLFFQPLDLTPQFL